MTAFSRLARRAMRGYSCFSHALIFRGSRCVSRFRGFCGVNPQRFRYNCIVESPKALPNFRRKFGKALGLSTMQLYLKRWGFTPQKPLKRDTQRDPRKIKAWLKQEYPRIALRARRGKAVIYWSHGARL